MVNKLSYLHCYMQKKVHNLDGQ